VQSGDFTFRYALTSGRDLSPEFLSRFGRAAMTPFELAQLLATDKFGNPQRPLQPSPSSFLELNADNVVVENWKGAEDGQGTILRLLEVAGRPATARLNFPLFNLERAWLTNAVEENHEELKVSGHTLEAPLKPHEILTLRVIASSPVQ
jgi:alpha-mannosidase